MTKEELIKRIVKEAKMTKVVRKSAKEIAQDTVLRLEELIVKMASIAQEAKMTKALTKVALNEIFGRCAWRMEEEVFERQSLREMVDARLGETVESNRRTLVLRIAREAKMTPTQADKAMNAFFNGVTQSLKKGGKASFVGFGTFSVVRRKARMGRNPQTGAPITIAASRVPKFKPCKGLSSAVK